MGHIGHRHCRIYKQEPLVELVGVCDKRIDRAQSASETYSVPYFLDAQEMLNTLKPDLVSVCTGGYEYCSDHYEPTMQALNAGCHVLTEKPIADTIERAREMVETAEKNHRCFALDFNHRFTDAGRQAKKWQEEGRLGDLLFCNMALWIGKPEDYPSPYYHLKALNPHSIDIIRYFMLIPEACKLVLEACLIGNGGEIFAFDMGHPVKIAELAQRMIDLNGNPNIKIKYVGLRSGEKLYEEVLNVAEETLPTRHPKINIFKVREYDFDEVLKNETELEELSYSYDSMAIVKKMKDIVPEFISQHSIYEVLDLKNN